MNRIVIIGNGFDLAHNLKTSYNDFLKEYWVGIKNTKHKDEFIEFDSIDVFSFDSCKSLTEIVGTLNSIIGEGKFYDNSYNWSNPRIKLKIANDFFKKINDKHVSTNWVNIEMEYYDTIKKVLNRSGIRTDAFNKESASLIAQLNNEIFNFTKRFEDYLKNKVVPKYKEHTIPRLYKLLSNQQLNNNEEILNFEKEFPTSCINAWEKQSSTRKEFKFGDKKFDNSLFINFNFTGTIFEYIEQRNEVIFIHGKLADQNNNPVLLGFGDEMDKFYSDIEDLDQNEYLRFAKSFHYTKNENYKRIFDLLELENFQVQIMGHSCGLSDRTLLNSIFEHPNCKSIKVFYHQFESSNSYGEKDNYSDVIKNISRHFFNKKLMRERIVNKTYCEAMPQFDW
jgi:hypothetical protein